MTNKFATSIALAIFAMCGSVNCGSNPKIPAPTKNTAADSRVTTELAPTPTISERDIDGKAYSIDEKPITARTIMTIGDNRRPVFIENNRIAFASRRASLERWQVFEADLAKGFERRVSFDAGDAEPVAAIGKRLLIASSSDEQKSGERVLEKYQEALVPKALQHLLLEHPASGRKGTEWIRISRDPSPRWIVSVDRALKQALAMMITNETTSIFRISIVTKSREPETRTWTAVKVEAPPGVTGKPIDGRIFPDASGAVWSNGSILWTTDLKGGTPKRIGDDSLPAATDLALDPSGQWIVFSSPSPSRGLNLQAVHRSGRCLKTLTELPGDEIEPVFSPDGATLLFSQQLGDRRVIAKIAFGSTAVATAACP